MSLVAASLQKKESPPAQRFCRTTGAAPVGAVSNLRVSEIANLFFFSSRRRHTSFDCDWSSDVCSSDLGAGRISHGWDGDAEGGGAHQERTAFGEDDPGRQQYFVWAGCLSAAGAEFSVHARGGGPWARHGHRQLHKDLSALQDSAGRSGTGAEADSSGCEFGWRSAAEVHGALCRDERQASGFDDGACGYAVCRGQVKGCHHQRREVGGRWGAKEIAR